MTTNRSLKIVACIGGYNVWGFEYDGTYTGRLVYECLHLHPTRDEARQCLAARNEETAALARAEGAQEPL